MIVGNEDIGKISTEQNNAGKRNQRGSNGQRLMKQCIYCILFINTTA